MGKHRWARGKAVSPRGAAGRGVHRLLPATWRQDGGRSQDDPTRGELRTRAREGWGLDYSQGEKTARVAGHTLQFPILSLKAREMGSAHTIRPPRHRGAILHQSPASQVHLSKRGLSPNQLCMKYGSFQLGDKAIHCSCPDQDSRLKDGEKATLKFPSQHGRGLRVNAR